MREQGVLSCESAEKFSLTRLKEFEGDKAKELVALSFGNCSDYCGHFSNMEALFNSFNWADPYFLSKPIFL